METTNRFEYMSKIILYIIAAMLPLWFLPLTLGVEFGREVTFSILIILGLISWLLYVLKAGEIRFWHSPILWAGALVFLAFGASTIFSKAPWVSAFLADPVAERFFTLLVGLVLMALSSSVFRSADEIRRAVLILIFSGGVSGILSLLQFFGWSPYQFSFLTGRLPFLGGVDFNAVGTSQAQLLFLTVLFMAALGMIVGQKDP